MSIQIYRSSLHLVKLAELLPSGTRPKQIRRFWCPKICAQRGCEKATHSQLYAPGFCCEHNNEVNNAAWEKFKERLYAVEKGVALVGDKEEIQNDEEEEDDDKDDDDDDSDDCESEEDEGDEIDCKEEDYEVKEDKEDDDHGLFLEEVEDGKEEIRPAAWGR